MSLGLDLFDRFYTKAVGRALPIVGYRERGPCMAAIAATYDLPPEDRSLKVVRACVNRRRIQFLNRAYELSKQDKFFLVSGLVVNPHDFDPRRAIRAFNLCAQCWPTTMIYPPVLQQKRTFKSCGHSNFCPACWGAVAMRQYQQFRGVINAILRQGALGRVCVTPYITEQFVPASFSDLNTSAGLDEIAAACLTLRHEIARYKKLIERRRKQVQRATISAYWHIVPIPAENGWRLQFRQLFLSPPDKTPPADRIRIPGTREILKKTVALSGGKNWQERRLDAAENAINDMMIDFLRYPGELLTEQIDLAAAALHATAKQRMLGGYGAFRSAGSGLLKKMRKQDQEQQAEHARKRRA